MMDVLLVRPNEDLPKGSPLRETNRVGVVQPLGIASLAAALREAGHNPTVLDLSAAPMIRDRVLARMGEMSPSIIGIGSTTLVWPRAVEIAGILKEAFPSIPIVAGGPQVMCYPEESISRDCFDAGVIGEGEETFLEMVEAIEKEGSWADVRGTVVKTDGAITVNKPRPPIEDLDALPIPAFDLLPMSRYHLLTVERPFFTMVTSRGCPCQCSFCDQDFLGKKFRVRGPEKVAEEIELYVREFGAREIILFDETFTADGRRVLEICDRIISKRLHFRWSIRTRADALDRTLLAALKEAGCRRVHLGIGSGSPRVLEAMNRGITVDDVRNAVSTAVDLGIETRGDFLLGYPGDDPGSMRETLRFSRRLGLDGASYRITIPQPRTAIYREGLASGRIESDYWRDYTLGDSSSPPPVFPTSDYDEARLRRLRKIATLAFHLRPWFLISRLVRRLRRGRTGAR